MELKILFDYNSLNDDLHIGWGFSVLLNKRILFDTGEKGQWLNENIKMLNVNIDKIKKVVISHDHWDHTGGLWELLKHSKGIEVYGCNGFSDSFKKKVNGLNSNFTEVPSVESEKIKNFKIDDKIYTSGEIIGEYERASISEQALVIKKNANFRKIVIITGCAHPGIENIVQEIKSKFGVEKISLVIGGFHLMNMNERNIRLISDKFRKSRVEKVAPTHCSGKEAEKIFKQRYKENYVDVRVGKTIEI